MKIAYIYDAVYPWVKGGAERRIYEISWRLAERGYEIHCYGMNWWGRGEILDNGVHLHGICKPMKLYSGERRSIKEAAYFASKLLISINDAFDVVDCQNFPYLHCFSAKLLCSLMRQKLFITWHEVWGDYWHEYLGRGGIFGRSIEEAASRLTDKNIAVSERTKRDLERLGCKGVQVVPNGIDFEGINGVKASNKESDIIYVGRLARHKNVDLLLQALRLIASEVPDIKAMIIGDGPDMEKLRALTQELGLERNVEFTGFLESYSDALALMKASHVFASPSTREGFGMAALEANACGLPIVTVKHRMNAVCDLMNNLTGRICEPSAEGIAEAIVEELSSRGTTRQRCIENARIYDWEGICDLVEEVYF